MLQQQLNKLHFVFGASTGDIVKRQVSSGTWLIHVVTGALASSSHCDVLGSPEPLQGVAPGDQTDQSNRSISNNTANLGGDI